MPRDFELDSLRREEEQAFTRKQEAFRAYDEARKRADAAYEAMASAREERNRAQAEMNGEYEELQRTNAEHDEIWDEYGRIRDENNSQIESLKYEADSEYQQMHYCFENASSEYEYGDKAMASTYSQEGHQHKGRLAELNAQIRELGAAVKAAKADAQWRAPKVDSSAFRSAKQAYQEAKARYVALKEEFNRLKAYCDRLHDEFVLAKAAHENKKQRFQARLAEVKARKACEREQILDQADIHGSERGDAKIVKKSDGTIQIYSGGFASGDGLGHGHTAISKDGKVTYRRKAFAEHGKQNFVNEVINENGRYEGTFNGRPAIIRVTDAGNSNQMQVFYGGEGTPDGPGHNHVNIINGRLQFWREDGEEIYMDEKDGQFNNL